MLEVPPKHDLRCRPAVLSCQPDDDGILHDLYALAEEDTADASVFIAPNPRAGISTPLLSFIRGLVTVMSVSSFVSMINGNSWPIPSEAPRPRLPQSRSWARLKAKPAWSACR